MGGTKETTVPQRSATSVPKGFQAGSIRVHENNGEVHFHADSVNLKVAMPVATWFERYESLLAGTTKSIRYVDSVNKTILKVTLAITGKKKKREVDLCIEVNSAVISSTIEKINQFTHG